MALPRLPSHPSCPTAPGASFPRLGNDGHKEGRLNYHLGIIDSICCVSEPGKPLFSPCRGRCRCETPVQLSAQSSARGRQLVNGCPQSWFTVPNSDRCFYTTDIPSFWPEALAQCRALGPGVTLATLASHSVAQAVSTELQAQHSDQQFWTGVRRDWKSTFLMSCWWALGAPFAACSTDQSWLWHDSSEAVNSSILDEVVSDNYGWEALARLIPGGQLRDRGASCRPCSFPHRCHPDSLLPAQASTCSTHRFAQFQKTSAHLPPSLSSLGQ